MCAVCESGIVNVLTEHSLTCSFELVYCTICESVLVKALIAHNQTYSGKLIINIYQAQPHSDPLISKVQLECRQCYFLSISPPLTQ